MKNMKKGPVKGTPEWDKKVMGNRSDEMRINKMSNAIFKSSKTPDKIFAGGKSNFYPKKENTSTTVKRVAKKAVETMKDYASKRRRNSIAKMD
jgi:hypothetical protein